MGDSDVIEEGVSPSESLFQEEALRALRQQPQVEIIRPDGGKDVLKGYSDENGPLSLTCYDGGGLLEKKVTVLDVKGGDASMVLVIPREKNVVEGELGWNPDLALYVGESGGKVKVSGVVLPGELGEAVRGVINRNFREVAEKVNNWYDSRSQG